MKNSVELNLTLQGKGIQDVEKESNHFFRSFGLSYDNAQIPVMILRELVKNSRKFGRLAPGTDEITVRLQMEGNTYTIEVMNPVDDSCGDRLLELDKTIQFIRGYQDPYEAYSIKLAEAAAHPFNGSANDLRLVKIAYDWGVILDFFVNEDNFLIQSAVGSPAKN